MPLKFKVYSPNTKIVIVNSNNGTHMYWLSEKNATLQHNFIIFVRFFASKEFAARNIISTLGSLSPLTPALNELEELMQICVWDRYIM